MTPVDRPELEAAQTQARRNAFPDHLIDGGPVGEPSRSFVGVEIAVLHRLPVKTPPIPRGRKLPKDRKTSKKLS